MSVVSLAAERESRKPHWSGLCRCINCQHDFAGVGPMGEQWIECPKCGHEKAHTRFPFGAGSGDLAFECLCGSEALVAYKRRGRFFLKCMSCGTDQTSAIFGEAP